MEQKNKGEGKIILKFVLLWVVALLTQLWLGTGVFPVACICVSWMAMMLSYQITGFRLEHHK